MAVLAKKYVIFYLYGEELKVCPTRSILLKTNSDWKHRKNKTCAGHGTTAFSMPKSS